MQLLAGLEIEPVDHPGDGPRRARMQGLRQRPERVLAVCRLDQDRQGGVEAEGIKSVTVQAAVRAPTKGRKNEDEWQTSALIWTGEAGGRTGPGKGLL